MADEVHVLPIGTLPESTLQHEDQLVAYREDNGKAYRAKVGTLSAFVVAPNYYERPELFTADKTSITIPANTQVEIDGTLYISGESCELSTDDVKDAGVDVYIYACEPEEGSEPDFKLSRNSTIPDGYNASNSRKIGGFHCLCESVGTISGHPLSGYVTGDILPASVWDLKHRPVSEPEGMAYDEGTGRWYGIYLLSWDGEKLVSVYGGVPTTGTSDTSMHGLKFIEKLGKQGERLLSMDEFMAVAQGSNECTAINGEANPGNTGGHVDTAGRRMISDIGLEDCCGAFYQWTNNFFEHSAYGTALTGNNVSYWHTGNRYQYFTGCDWFGNRDSNGDYVATYNEDIDSEKMGDAYGMPRQARVGGVWSGAARCGSRCVYAHGFGSRANDLSAARCASEPRVAD